MVNREDIGAMRRQYGEHGLIRVNLRLTQLIYLTPGLKMQLRMRL